MRNIEVKRNGETVATLDLYSFLLQGDKSKDSQLMPEDVLFVPPIGPMVGVAGNVERPAIYEMKGRTRLSEAIKMAGGATADAYLQRVQVERVSQRKSKVVLDLDLQRIKGKDDIVLEDGDLVKVYPIANYVANQITLQGNVRRPGTYEWRNGLRVRDILRNYDALLPDTLLDYALVERRIPPDYHQEYRTFNLQAVLSGRDEHENILLEPYDTVTVLNKWAVVEKESVRITGAVNQPGEFYFKPNMKLSDLLKLAGGMKKYAFTQTAELTRVVPTETGPRTEQISVSPAAAMDGDSLYDISLQKDDYLFVRAVPEWQLYRKVSVTGEVKFPGDYALQKGEKLSSLLVRAGGYTNKAYLRGATFVRQSVKDQQQKQITDMADRLMRELLASTAADVGAELDPQQAQIDSIQAKQKKIFIDSLKGVQAKGRVVLRLEDPKRLKGTPSDLELEDGDQLYVPSNPQAVQVIGAVYNQTSFVYEPDKDWSYYVDRSGGYTATADSGKIYILKVDGTAVQPGGGIFWSASASRWQTGLNGKMEPGDTVVVPDQLDKIAWLKNTKDLTTILYQIAVGAGVLLRL